MSSQSTSLNKAGSASSKSSSSSTQNASAASATQQFFSSADSRRVGTSTIHGNTPNPRGNQTTKPKHKSNKRFRPLADDDADAEAVSMQNPHGRRGQQSITHLMQFALPPRPQASGYGRYGGNGGPGGARKRTWGLGSGYHAMDKARYIHANYRFIVSPQGEYHAQAKDADVHLEWTNVLQIIASAKTQNSSCPICLGEPTAPRMAKCGHIFCLPCLIRYMHSEDPAANSTSSLTERKARWKKCPICWDSIYISETRPVRWYVGSENETPREGGDVVLRLVRRKNDSTLAMPRESAEPLSNGEEIPWYFAAEVMDFARVMKGSEDYMVSQYDDALTAVEQLEREDELLFGEDTEWTGRAKRMLTEAKEKIKGIGNPPEQPRKPTKTGSSIQLSTAEIDQQGSGQHLFDQRTPDNESSVGNSAEESSTSANGYVVMESDTSANQRAYVPRTLTEMRQRQFEKPQPSEYLFYHALQHFYLSSLDIRILKAAFGSYSAFPSSILPRVERVSSGHIVDDDLRKRVKYLAHLPYGCEVGFLECDWTDTVPASVLAEFETQIKKRRTRNEEKEARDEKERIRIQKDEDKEYAALRRTRRLSSVHEPFSAEQLPTLSGSVTDGSAPIAASPPWPRRSTAGFTSLASPSTSPTAAQRTVWGTALVPPLTADGQSSLPRDTDLSQEPEDGWLQGWERDLLAEGELAAQMEAIHVDNGGKLGAKKGKKGKKITLMSTSNNRRGA